jgi:hypothetical protein
MVRKIITALIVVLILFSVVVWVRTSHSPVRNSIVFIGDPIVIVSWESSRSQYVMLTIPSTVQIDALHGYGQYSIASLWNLDAIEKRRGAIFLPSLTENFAVPIGWYSTTAGVVGDTNEGVVQSIKSKLSFLSLAKSVFTHSSSLTVVDLIAVWRATRAIDASTTRILDFRSLPVGTTTTMPDGSTALQFDPEKYDGIVGDFLEDVSLRQESIRLAIYNTTTMPGIGSKVARVIGQLGGYVVFVGNDESGYEGLCELKGTKERLRSITSTVIQMMYGCRVVETTESMRGDIVLRLGKEFEKRYLPF